MPSSSSSTEPSVLVFDLDDTLYLERDFAFSGFVAVEAHLRALHGDGIELGTCRNLFEQGVRGEIFNRALEQFGLPDDAATIATLVEVYRGHAPQIALCPDTTLFLSADHRRRAIITDGPAAMQRAKIAALGIGEHFDFIIPTGELPHGMGKPHPRAFERVMAWSGEAGASHVYIADNPAKDFIAPRALGWRTVQIDRDGRVHSPEPKTPDHGAERRIGSLDELVSALNSLD